MTTKANLVIDLGNSQTRVLVQSGVNSKNMLGQKLHIIDNRYAEVKDDYSLPEGYDISKSTLFMFEGSQYAHGEVVDAEFSKNAIRPTAVAKKHQQKRPIGLALTRAFIEGFAILEEMYEILYSGDDVVWNVAVLLPPGDVNLGKEEIIKMVKSITNVYVTQPVIEYNINIENVVVFPEGAAAYFGVLMTRGALPKKVVPRPGYEYLNDSVTLVLDIGAGTTDFFVSRKGTTVDATKGSVNLGGNNISSNLLTMLSEQGFDLPFNDVAEGVITGKVKVGRKFIDVAPGIPAIKKSIATGIVQNIISKFEQASFPTSTIDAVLVCGGGSVTPSIESDKSLGDYVLDSLKVYLPEDLKLVEIPEKVDARKLNIIGAGLLASYSFN